MTSQLRDMENTEAAYDCFIDHIKSEFLRLHRSKGKRQSYHQPWITQGLLKSCKTKSNRYFKFIKNPFDANN